MYVITGMLLKVSFNTKKNVHHAMHVRYRPVLLVFNNTFNNVSGITYSTWMYLYMYNMLANFIGVNATVNNI
jgi:hypothetical protein